MMKNIKWILTVIIQIALCNGLAVAQNKKGLTVGNYLPGTVLQTVPKSKDSKLIILDFWSTYCSSCMEAFPKVEALQKEFEGQLQFVLVNSWESEKQVRERLSQINAVKRKSSQDTIRLPKVRIINGDKIFIKYFPARTIPHHVWLNDKGRVLAVTNGYNATARNIGRMLNGQDLKLAFKQDLSLQGYNPYRGLLKPIHSSVVPRIYSSVIKYNPGWGGGEAKIVDTNNASIRRVFVNRSIASLYQIAFESTEKKLQCIITAKDKGPFTKPDKLKDGDLLDEWNEQNLYSYEMLIPLAEQKNFYRYMCQDLNRYFSIEKGIEGVIEKRRCKTFVLKKLEGALSRLTSAERSEGKKDTAHKVTGSSFGELVNELKIVFEKMEKNSQFIDETGIASDFKPGIEFKGELNDVESVRKQLYQYGLVIIETEREMEVLVIRDNKGE